ncbi:MAG: NAD(P)H-hydrate epimerase [Phycisphaerales bacterium]|nr:NAD(P)H-hydrate epimerase [Phycisphaerales bacterium]
MRQGHKPSDHPRPGDGQSEPQAPAMELQEESELVFSRAAVREVDRLATSEYGLPSMVLMENAALGLVSAVAEVTAHHDDPGVLICCGGGSNGGDGLAAARHLHNEGYRVGVLMVGPASSYKGDAATQLAIVRKMGIHLRSADEANPERTLAELASELGGPGVLVDALIGTGLDRPIKGPMAALIDAINNIKKASRDGCKVVSADLPSGLDADSGRPLGTGVSGAVRADLTVTFVGLKKGFTAFEAQEFLGEVVVWGIGAPVELTRRLGEPMETTEYPGDVGADQEDWPDHEEESVGRPRE